MRKIVKVILRDEFAAFVRKAYSKLNEGSPPLESETPYIEYICAELTRVAVGDATRAILNIAPRHLKTFVGSICLPAWRFLHHPSSKVMIIARSEGLVTEIARDLKTILDSAWYREISGFELVKGHSGVLDFGLTGGGRVMGFSIGSSITGRGADLIIIDDPVDIGNAGNLELLQKTNQYFYTVIQSRLNRPKSGRIVLIAHRVHPGDLSGSLLNTGGWHHIELPMVATEDKIYQTSRGNWHRKAGQVLRPAEFDQSKIDELRATTHNPDFDTLYQQDVSGGFKNLIRPEHFPRFDPKALSGELRIVLSVDPGDRGGPTNSFSVGQVWCVDGEKFYLLDQFRRQCSYRELRKACLRLVHHYRPNVVLVEDAGQGRRLLEDEEGGQWTLVRVAPGQRSKVARLRPHLGIITACRIHLPHKAELAAEFIAEVVAFPHGEFDDQVDALTQMLDYVSKGPVWVSPPVRATAYAGSRGSVQAIRPHAERLDGNARGVVVAASRRLRCFY